MRFHLKRNVALGVLLLGVIYLVGSSDFIFPMGIQPMTSLSKLDWPLSQSLGSKKSWVDQGKYLPLNVSYQLLAGSPAMEQKFLAVGLASVKRKRGSYLLSTLNSLFFQSSSEERSAMVVVVLLADFDSSWREATVGEIQAAHPSELDQGQLLVIHVPQQFYPPLTGLKRNFNDAPDRVSYRSKQNLDYSFLIHYSGDQGQYYLQLEDDIISAANFVSAIRKNVVERERKSDAWVTLEFSALGYIGKLYRSANLPLLARFLFLFYQEMPCDWLMSHFRTLLTQKEPILIKPSLFQHMGTFSSFQGTYNKLKDKDFEMEAYSNPPAEVYSDMSVYADHIPRLAWEAGEGYFWGRSPQNGNYLTVVFGAPVVVTGVKVDTGLDGKDLLEFAVVELGKEIETTERGEKSCKEFQLLGNIENGRFALHTIQEGISSPSSCLRLRVTAQQNDWIVVRKIRITIKT